MATYHLQLERTVSDVYDRPFVLDWTPQLRGLVYRVGLRLERRGSDVRRFVRWVANWKPVTFHDWIHPHLILSKGSGYIGEFLEELSRDLKWNTDNRIQAVDMIVNAFFLAFPNMATAYRGRCLYFAREEAEKILDAGDEVGEVVHRIKAYQESGGKDDPRPVEVFGYRKMAGKTGGRRTLVMSDEFQWRVDLFREIGLGDYLQAQGVGQEDDPHRFEKVYEAATGERFRLGLFQSAAVRKMLEKHLLPVRKTVEV